MRVALAQLKPAADLERDCDTACSVIGSLGETDLVLFPELFLGGYCTENPGPAATTAEGDAISRIGQSCARSGTAAVIGFTERLDQGLFANSAACLEANGDLAAIYRKTHLFGEGERSAFKPGDSMTLAQLSGHSVGPQICFDVEFPEPSRMMARHGAELIATIAANMAPYATDHRLAARARALDNRLPHLYVNRVGVEAGHRFVGESCVIAADGSVTAELAAEEGILEAEIEFHPQDPETSYLEHLRSNLNFIVQDKANGGEA